jgi:type 2A phosphatase activator TIP41
MTSAPPRPFDHGSSKGIQLDSWRLTSTKLPILNATESDAYVLHSLLLLFYGFELTALSAPLRNSAQDQLHLPLPEICFGNNTLVLQDSSTGLCFEWNALDALKAVEKDTEVKVAYADEWARG